MRSSFSRESTQERVRQSAEPEALRRGRDFHRRVQAAWAAEAEGDVRIEALFGSSGWAPYRSGRVDILVDAAESLACIVEIKATDWDDVCVENRRRLLPRHRRQLWSLVEQYARDHESDVAAAMVYPTRPRTPGLGESIEGFLGDWGILVEWFVD